MAPYRTDTTSAHAALREAARALSVVRNTPDVGVPLTESSRQRLATDAATTLDAIARLLLATSHDATPMSGTAHTLQALAQQVEHGASLARRAADRDSCGAHPSIQLTDEPCGASG